MSKLPRMSYSDAITKTTQVRFGGLRHAENCGDGELYDMKNLTCADYPVMRTRSYREFDASSLSGIYKVHVGDGWVLWIDEVGNLNYYAAGTTTMSIEIAQLHDYKEKNQIIPFGERLLILPERISLNIKYPIKGHFETIPTSLSGYAAGDAVLVGQTYKWELCVFDGTIFQNMGSWAQDMNAKLTVAECTFRDGTIYDEAAHSNTISFSGLDTDLRKVFKAGDAIEISGLTTIPDNNKTAIVREVEEHILRFSDYCFKPKKDTDGTALTEWEEAGTIVFSRTVPVLDFYFEHGMRLWGYRGKEIFASKQGDPTNFNVFDGLTDDSWYLETQGKGDFTGAIGAYYPYFFKRGCMITVYGTMPSAFQTYEKDMPGVAKGMEHATAAAGGYVFWVSDDGVQIYAGDYPQGCREVFGNGHIQAALACSDGTRYFVQLKSGAEQALYCFDTERKLWMKEDDVQATCMYGYAGSAYAATENGVLVKLSGQRQSIEEEEQSITSFAEFGDITMSEPNRKAVSKVQLRLWTDGTLTVKLSYDGGAWQTVRQIEGDEAKTSVYLPVIPRRCDHFRIRLEGTGQWRLYSMAIEHYIGSEIF